MTRRQVKAQPPSLQTVVPTRPKLTDTIGVYLLTRLEIRIATFAALLIVCATTSSAAAVAVHARIKSDHTHTLVSTYSVSVNLPDQPLDVARAVDDPSVVASADQFYNATKFDDLRGTSNVVRPTVHVTSTFQTQRRLIALDPEVRLTPTLKPGQRKILRRGQPVLEQVTERLVLWDDVVMRRQLAYRRVLEPGRQAVVLQGAPLTWGQLAASTRFRKLVGVYTMEATAYTAWTATSNPTGRTASGTPAGYGVVAVDPRIIRLGSHVFVPGYGLAIASDTGGAIVGNRIDLCMESVRDAIIFGRRAVKVYVVAE
jgi:3D (Asp-Asp-Asp) domain-containing protein